MEGSGISVIVAVVARPKGLLIGLPSERKPVSVPDVALMSPRAKLNPLPKIVIMLESSAISEPPKVQPDIFSVAVPLVIRSALTAPPVSVTAEEKRASRWRPTVPPLIVRTPESVASKSSSSAPPLTVMVEDP